MRELLLVLSFKMASILRNVLLPSWKVQMKNLASVVVFGGFAVGTFLVARGVTAYLLETANIGLFLYHRFLSMILYVFFVTVNISNLIVCFATLYRSDEVGFLMALPISHAKIFLLRFVDNFFYSSSTMALIGVSAILGYASYFGFPWYLSVFCILGVFLPFMLIAGVVAVVTLMGLIKVAVIVGVRVLLSVVGVVYLGAVYFYFRSTNPVHLVTSVLEQYPAINGYFGNLDPPFVHFLPSHWVSEFLYWSVVGNTDRAAPHFMFLFFTMFGLVVLAGLLARKWYYRTWLTASDAQAMKATRSGSSARTPVFRFDQSTRAQSFLLGNNPQGQLIFKRDFWMFFRDPGQWLHFLLMIVLVLIFLITVQSLDLPQTLPLMRAVGYLVVFIFIGFLVASVALRFVFPAISLEGRTFWAVRTSPLDLSKLYFHKLRFSIVLTVVLAEILVFGSLPIFSPDLFLTFIGAICAFFVALALTTLHLGAGAAFALYREKNPVRVASSHGASLAFLGSMVYLLFLVLLLIVPLNNYYQATLIPAPMVRTQFILPVGIIGVLSLGVALFATRLGLRSIQHDY